MTDAAKQLEGQLLRLDSADRAEIAERILLSLDEPGEDDADQLWLEEAGRRLAALRAGEAAEISEDEALRRARSSLS